MPEDPFHRIGVVGLGLIGGSLVKTLRRIAPDRELFGVDFDGVLAQAREELDAAFPLENLATALAQSDLVFLATPISAIVQLMPTVAQTVRPGTVVTDTGSTKAAIMTHAQRHFMNGTFFVGGHPMAGREHGGWEHADAHLFEGAAYVLTPSPNFPETLLHAMQSLVQSLGAHVLSLDPYEHDRIVAETSHLPQLLAIALADFIARPDAAREARVQLAGSGLRDMTRLAASPFALWHDILHSNRENVTASLLHFIASLQQLAQDFEQDALQSRFRDANQIRRILNHAHANRREPTRYDSDTR